MFKRKKKPTPEEARLKIEETIENLDSFVRRSETKRRSLMDKAKLAKARGDKVSYNMSVGALKVLMQQQKRAEQMVLSMEVMLDYRDVNEMTTQFFENMQGVCTQMGQLPDMKKLTKVSAEFNKNIARVNQQNMVLDEYMTAFGDSFNENEGESFLGEDEISKIIEREISAELDSDELNIKKQVEQAKTNI